MSKQNYLCMSWLLGILFILVSFPGQIYALPVSADNTTITSDRMELETTADFNIFKFFDNVHLVGNEIEATCDELEVTAFKNSSSQGSLANDESIKKILARGHVFIKQPTRTIHAGKATILPQEGRVTLEDAPQVVDEEGVVKGYRIVFYKNDSKAHVEAGPNGERPSITLPKLPLLTEDKDTSKKASKSRVSKENTHSSIVHNERK